MQYSWFTSRTSKSVLCLDNDAPARHQTLFSLQINQEYKLFKIKLRWKPGELLFKLVASTLYIKCQEFYSCERKQKVNWKLKLSLYISRHPLFHTSSHLPNYLCSEIPIWRFFFFIYKKEMCFSNMPILNSRNHVSF